MDSTWDSRVDHSHDQHAVTCLDHGSTLRGSADWLWSAGWSGVPSVGGPGFADEASDEDDGVGEGDVGLDDACVSFGADQQFPEAAVVPGVGPFHDPAGPGLEWGAFLADDRVAAEFGQEVPGGAAVVAGVQVHGDLLGQVEAEAGQFLQGGAEQRGVVTVGAGDDAADRQAGTIGEQGALGSQFPAIHRGPTGRFTSAGCLDQASVHGQVLQSQAHDPVVGLQAELFELVEDAGSDPLITPGADRGGRAGGVGDPFIGRPEHEDLDEFVEHDPVTDPRPVTSQRMEHHPLGQQRGELVPQWTDDRRWQSRHEHLAGEVAEFDTSIPTETRACTPATTHLSAEPLSW